MTGAQTRAPVALSRKVQRPGWRLRWHIVLFLAPAVVLYTLFVIYPLVGSARLSLFDAEPGGGEEFVGLDNFRLLFGDPRWSTFFWRAVRNTGQFFAIHMVVQNSLGLLLAVLLTAPVLRARSVLRALIFSPTVISVVLVGFVWQLILSPLWGVSTTLLDAVGLGRFYAPWLGQESTALTTISLMSVWQYTGVPMLLFSAALLSIPDELIDAAKADGAGAFRIFRSIQLPLILPTVGIVTILTLVGSARAFDLIFVVQGIDAGPNYATDVMGTLFYRTFAGFFTQLPNPTMAATIATVTIGMVGFVIAVYLLFVQRRLQRYEA